VVSKIKTRGWPIGTSLTVPVDATGKHIVKLIIILLRLSLFINIQSAPSCRR
jgi:hypothetical protein